MRILSRQVITKKLTEFQFYTIRNSLANGAGGLDADSISIRTGTSALARIAEARF